MSTMYEENERELSDEHLDKFGLNSAALRIALKTYVNEIAPTPIRFVYKMPFAHRMDQKPGSVGLVEMTLRKPIIWQKMETLDLAHDFGFKLFCYSYYTNVRPKPVSFFKNGFEIHLRTPGFEESKRKNIVRQITPWIK